MALLLSACGSAGDPPPPTSPLAAPPGPAAPVRAQPPVLPTLPRPTVEPTTVTAGPPVPPDEQALEVATGQALALLAEWLGRPQTDLTVAAAEALVWPDACIGIERPGQACAELLTPGFRIALTDAFAGRHTLHADARGGFAWAGETRAIGTVVGFDATTGRLMLDPTAEGDTPAPPLLRAAPGTRWELAAGGTPADLPIGERVLVAFDAAPDGGAEPVLAWLLVLDAEASS